MLVHAVVVAGDRHGAHVDLAADRGVPDVAQVVRLAARADLAVLHLDEVADARAVAEHLRVAARVETHVDLAEQARREDRRDRVFRELVTAVDLQRHDRPVGLRIELDLLDAADDDACRLDRRSQLESADIVERGDEVIPGRVAERQEVADLERQEDDRADAHRHEHTHPQVQRRAVHTRPSPRARAGPTRGG